MNTELENISQAMKDYFESVLLDADKLGPIHRQYYESIRDYMMRGGKRIRPLLVVTGYKTIKERVEIKHLYRASSSVEFLHNGSLVHDDLIDHDETRRGAPTVHAMYREWIKKTKQADADKAKDFGAAMAILTGDSILNMGPEIIAASELEPIKAMKCIRYYQSAYHDLADGVLLEMMMVQDPRSTAETYLEMIRLKTAVLFEKALLMGATMADATDSQLKTLSEFAVKVGQAFQVQDDILGSFGDASVTGKAVDGDIREGKKTMLVVKTYESGKEEHRKTLGSLLGKRGMTPEEVDMVRNVFKDSGALEATKKLMADLLSAGQKALDKARPPLQNKYKRFLIELSDFLVNRNY
jgi:geranylgeranyl diphosphate synthase type I